jgi:hypothetical protein
LFVFHTKDLYDYLCVTGLVGEENGRNAFGARRLPARNARRNGVLRGVLFVFSFHIGIEMIRTKVAVEVEEDEARRSRRRERRGNCQKRTRCIY